MIFDRCGGHFEEQAFAARERFPVVGQRHRQLRSGVARYGPHAHAGPSAHRHLRRRHPALELAVLQCQRHGRAVQSRSLQSPARRQPRDRIDRLRTERLQLPDLITRPVRAAARRQPEVTRRHLLGKGNRCRLADAIAGNETGADPVHRVLRGMDLVGVRVPIAPDNADAVKHSNSAQIDPDRLVAGRIRIGPPRRGQIAIGHMEAGIRRNGARHRDRPSQRGVRGRHPEFQFRNAGQLPTAFDRLKR